LRLKVQNPSPTFPYGQQNQRRFNTQTQTGDPTGTTGTSDRDCAALAVPVEGPDGVQLCSALLTAEHCLAVGAHMWEYPAAVD
jgi:hypothetical protein